MQLTAQTETPCQGHPNRTIKTAEIPHTTFPKARQLSKILKSVPGKEKIKNFENKTKTDCPISRLLRHAGHAVRLF